MSGYGDIYDADDGSVISEGAQAPSDVAPVFSHADDAEDLQFPTPMSLEEAKQLIFEKHNVGLDPNDPILMLVTLHQGFAADQAKICRATIHQLEVMLQSTGESYADTVASLFQTLKGDAEQASIAHAIGMIKAFTETTQNHRQAMRRHSWLMAALTTLAVGSVGLLMAFS